ncbi:MAG: GNAT family N-acetyltransferase, partial [Cyanobacteria bacterium P01_H01_bin.119]
LQHLLQLYLHDESEFSGRSVNQQGLFHYPYLDLYWSEPGRFPFLIYTEKALAGFALIRNLAPPADKALWQMAEFFIVRKYRRRGMGQAVAHQLFDRFGGNWQIKPIRGSLAAQRFWQRVTADYRAQHPGKCVFIFEADRSP